MPEPTADDRTLLHRYEPVLRFTQGEMFFPTAVEPYLARSSLWRVSGPGTHTRLGDVGEIDSETLVELSDDGAVGTCYLRFVQAPMRYADYRTWRRSADRPRFAAVGRWARVGLVSRLVDAGFALTLSLRGVVPGGTVAVAEQQYRSILADQPAPVCYGRVVRDGGYIACHYLYFYVMNDFRSTFYGVNDHEADWEQVIVYLTDPQDGEPRGVAGEPELAWVAYAAHDLQGADLRRRADDPELELVDGAHPVVYVGAGSHASYFLPGEYVFAVRPPFVRRGLAAVEAIGRFWSDALGQGAGGTPTRDAVAVPFVDYARGDGVQIGPGTEHGSSLVTVTGEEPWVSGFRGLWGLDTGDPFGGERAPAGPMFQRDGTVRRSWSDPMGFAGLDRAVPPHRLVERLAGRVATLADELQQSEAAAADLRSRLRSAELDRWAASAAGFAATQRSQAAVEHLESALAQAVRERDAEADASDAATRLLRRAERVDPGALSAPDAHIQHRHLPAPSRPAPRAISELWAATSGALLLVLLAAVLVLPIPHKPAAFVAAVVLFLGVDATMRGRGLQFLIGYTIAAAVVAAVIVAVTYWQWAILLTVALLVVAIIRGNMGELRSLRAAARRADR